MAERVGLALPRSVRNLVAAVVAAGGATLAVCAIGLAGDDLERADVVVVLGAGMLLAELFPLRIPGREEETSFSAAFSFALLFTHGTDVTVVVATASSSSPTCCAGACRSSSRTTPRSTRSRGRRPASCSSRSPARRTARWASPCRTSGRSCRRAWRSCSSTAASARCRRR